MLQLCQYQQLSCRATNLLDHLFKLLLFILLESFVVLNRGNIQLMLGLGLRGLKRASKDCNFNIFQDLNGDKVKSELVTWLCNR